MKPVHLTTTCPTCDGQLKGYHWYGVHAYGETFETCMYKCGCEIKWIPNFSKAETVIPCKHSPAGDLHEMRSNLYWRMGEVKMLPKDAIEQINDIFNKHTKKNEDVQAEYDVQDMDEI